MKTNTTFKNLKKKILPLCNPSFRNSEVDILLKDNFNLEYQFIY